MVDLTGKRILISRTDSIGDVMLTLPICSWIKANFQNTTLVFLGRNYTKDVVEAYRDVDLFVDWQEHSRVDRFRELKADAIIHVFPQKEIARLAKKAGIALRVGTSHRLFHLTTCNYRISFTRKNSEYHEAQLNHALLRPFGLNELPTLEHLTALTDRFQPEETSLPENLVKALKTAQKSVILHPKSQGSAREWPIENYLALTNALIAEGVMVFYTGTAKEGEQFRSLLPDHPLVHDTTGTMNLKQLITFIGHCNALVACSTGPLHIAGFRGIRAIGLFSPRRPIHPGRWRALGSDVRILVYDENCPACASKQPCDCITQISVQQVMEQIR